MTKKTLKKKYDRLVEIHQQLEDVKALYKEQDELLNELVEECTEFSTREYKAVIVDVFEDKNSVWKPTKMNRYKLQVA